MSELMDFVNVELKKRKIRKMDFAEGIGVSRPAIHAWEIDAAQPIDENVKKIADFLDIPFSKLIAMRSGVENEEPETEKAATPEDDGNEKRVDCPTLSKSPNLIQNTIIKPGLGNMKNFHKLIHHCPNPRRILTIDRIRKL